MGCCPTIVNGAPCIPGGNGIHEIKVAGTDYNASVLGDPAQGYRVRSIAGTGGHKFSWGIPFDFLALVDLALVGFANATIVDQDIDLLSVYGAPGQDRFTHTGSDTTTLYSFTQDIITEIDVSSLYPNLAAGDWCGLMVDHNAIGTTVNYLGLRIKYVR